MYHQHCVQVQCEVVVEEEALMPVKESSALKIWVLSIGSRDDWSRLVFVLCCGRWDLEEVAVHVQSLIECLKQQLKASSFSLSRFTFELYLVQLEAVVEGHVEVVLVVELVELGLEEAVSCQTMQEELEAQAELEAVAAVVVALALVVGSTVQFLEKHPMRTIIVSLK